LCANFRFILSGVLLSDKTRQGNINVSYSQENLKMVVWIKGDEDYAAAFCLTAEEAMEQLSIKRTRLTQISGRELRVGRIKDGRYIRPVYRQCDLEEYKSWTRSTATHQKSASAINSAAEELYMQTQKIINTNKDLKENLDRNLSRTSYDLKKFSKDLLEKEQFRQIRRLDKIYLNLFHAIKTYSSQMGKDFNELKLSTSRIYEAVLSQHLGNKSLESLLKELPTHQDFRQYFDKHKKDYENRFSQHEQEISSKIFRMEEVLHELHKDFKRKRSLSSCRKFSHYTRLRLHRRKQHRGDVQGSQNLSSWYGYRRISGEHSKQRVSRLR